jgi:hypothetical protein
MKRVMIWDMDWFEKNSFTPKPDAMKVTSFHKQSGDNVYFIESTEDLTFDYDLIYVFRDMKNTNFPPLKILDSPKSRLCGKEFIYYQGYWEPDASIAMTRPSYTIYPLSNKNIYKGAHVIQLFYGKSILRNKQDFTNFIEQPRKKSLVVDQTIWEAAESDIVEALEELHKLKHIEFLHSISLKRITQSEVIKEAFLKLNIIGGTNMPFVNDLGDDFEDAKQIIDFIAAFKASHDVRVRGIKFHSVIYDHYQDHANGIKDLERILKIITYGKKHKVLIEAVAPKQRLQTPYWAFFEVLVTWTKYNPYTSYIQAMLASTSSRTDTTWENILNDTTKWSTPRVWFLLHIWVKYPEIIGKYGFITWGGAKLDISKVDLNSVAKSATRFEQDNVLAKIQLEIERGEW